VRVWGFACSKLLPFGPGQVIGKIGYGTTSEVLAHGKPLVYVWRDHWNEQGHLLELLQQQGHAVAMPRDDFYKGNWRVRCCRLPMMVHPTDLVPHTKATAWLPTGLSE
jgi:hypothetical protein